MQTKQTLLFMLMAFCAVELALCEDVDPDEAFMKWALKNTAVTDIAINAGTSLFVTLGA